MTTALRVVLALVLAGTLTGCCIRRARTNRCVLCQPTMQCVRQQVWPPSQWCWGNCQVDNVGEELPNYDPSAAPRTG